MSNSTDCNDSRFYSILQLDRPLSPLDVNNLKFDRTYWDQEGAVALIQYLFLEDVWKNYFRCLLHNVSKPMRTNEEAVEMADLEEERDKLAREHYILRKKNMHATALIDKFQETFQIFQDKQSKAASEIYDFAEKLRGDHLILKEEVSKNIENTKNSLVSQRKENEKMLAELKALQTEVAGLSERFNKMDLNTLDRKTELLVRGNRLSTNNTSYC